MTRLLILLFPILISCNSTRNISGAYRSKFAVGGFFGTRVVLNADSSFTYRMRGDMVYDTAAGKYQVQQKVLLLHYEPLATDPSLDKESLSIHEAMLGSKNLHEPGRYVIGHKKLFLTDKNGLKVKRQWGYSKVRKYVLFGFHWHYRRFYLKRLRSSKKLPAAGS